MKMTVLVFVMLACLFGCNKKLIVVHQENIEKRSVPVVAEQPKADTAGNLGGIKRSAPTIDTKESLNPVYFDFDKSDVRISENGELRRWVEAIDGKKITLSGYCDERGTDRYNFWLGKRRAISVMRWLRTNGITGEIECVSYGKSALARVGCGEDESCHQCNRRVEIKTDIP